MTEKIKTNPRRAAFDSLRKIEESGRYSNLEIDSTLEKCEMNQADRGLYTRLVYGVTERRLTLDYIISQYSRMSADKLDHDVLTALRLGVYQMMFMDRIPDHSAVNESVELVSRTKSGYVNAVLRSFIRGGKKYTLPEDEEERLEVQYSVPREICRIYKKACPDDIDALLEAMNREPHIALRLNRLKNPKLPEGCTESVIARDVVLTDCMSDEIREGIADGRWFVQDEASRITSLAVGAKPGETVIDTCSCPGGKSFSMAIDMADDGAVYSFDLHKNKLSLVDKGAERLGIHIIKTEARDARKPKDELIGQADRVLCDAPCSGLGVIAKKPEIRYKNIKDIENLPKIQLDVLKGAAEYVRVGGVIVYSTCTLNPDENEGVVKAFLESTDSFKLEENEYLCGGMRTFFPHRDGCDGFFAARMIRIK